MALKTISEAAEIWGVSAETVRRLARIGLIETIQVGRRVLIADDEIMRIIAGGIPSSAAYKVCCEWLPG